MLSSEDIDTIAKRAFNNETVQVLDYQLLPHSNKKLGFLGNHQNLQLRVKRTPTSSPETSRFFIKSLFNVSESQSSFIRDRGIYSQEAEFFNRLLPELEQDFNGELWAPRCYLANDKLLVLEDMRTRGFAMHDDKIFSGESLKSALRAQARLHASSLLAEARLGRCLKDVYPMACREQIFNGAARYGVHADLVERITNKHGRDHRRIMTGLHRGWDRIANPEGRGKMDRVICHGDGWPNNVLFDERLQPALCVLVDYQLVRYAARMFDVGQMIYLSTTREIRKREEREAIEAYHMELCEVLLRNNPELQRPSLGDLLEEYEDVRLSAMYSSILYYPIINISEKLFAEYENDLDGLYKKIVFRKDNDYLMELCDSDPGYGRRLNELVLEMADYCEKLSLPVEEGNNL